MRADYDCRVTERRTSLWPKLIAIGIPLLAWLAIACWSFSAPVGSSPDDDFHLASIWCGLGDREGLCEQVDDGPTRYVPAPLVNAPCFAFQPDEDASCWDPSVEGMAVAPRANVDGLYPRLFYATMSTFASEDPQLSVLTIRLVNATITVGLLTAVFWTLPRRLRPALLVSTIATSVPLGLFLIGSTNPSSWAMLSAAMTWICVYGSTQTTGRRRSILAGLAVLGATLGAGARADAAVFAVYGVLIALMLGLSGVRRLADLRAQAAPLAGALLAVCVSVGFYLTARQGGAALGGLDPTTERLTKAQHLSNFLEVPSLWTGALGQANLGWFDTPMPSAVWVLSTAVFAGALFIGLRSATTRRTIVVALALVAMWLVPFVMLAQSNALVGSTVQPRYLIPLLVIALGVASVRDDADAAWDGPRFALASGALWIAMTIALHQNMRRYIAGADDKALDPGANSAWWWTGAPQPLAVWVLGSLAFGGMLALLWLAKRPAAPARAVTEVV